MTHKHRRWLAKQTPKAGPTPECNCLTAKHVGIIQLHNHIPTHSSSVRWSLAVPKALKRPT